MRYLVDTDMCIHAMRGNAQVVGKMSKLSPSEIAISSITCYELYTGAAKCKDPQRERAKVDVFVGTLTQVLFDLAAASNAAQLRASLEARGLMIGPYDVLIAGHAHSLGLALVTGNTKEFSRIGGLALEDWGVTTP